MTRDRRTYLGSTDIAAVLGLSPWRTEWQVWDGKLNGEPEPPPDAWWRRAPAWYGPGFAIAEAAWWGMASERANVAAYSRLTDTIPEPVNGPIEHPQHPHLASSPDALIDDDGVLECKESNDHTWRTAWADGPPPHVRTQALWHLACTGRAWCDISVRVVGRGGKLQDPIRILRDDAEIDALVGYGDRWWRTYVQGRRSPGAGAHDLPALALRAPTGPPPIPTAAHPHLRATVDELKDQRRQLAAVKQRCDELQAQLVEHLVGAQATDAYLTGDDKPSWTYRPVQVTRPNLGTIRAAHKALNPTGRERTPAEAPQLPEGVTPEQIATTLAVLDAYANTVTEHRFNLSKETP